MSWAHGIQCIIFYTLLYILNISYILSAVTKKQKKGKEKKRKALLEAQTSLPKSLIARAACFLEYHFPQRELYHSMPMKSLSNVSQSYSAGNERPLGAQTQVLWSLRKPFPSTRPHPFLAKEQEFLTWRPHIPEEPMDRIQKGLWIWMGKKLHPYFQYSFTER